jgi:hypothetical protein
MHLFPSAVFTKGGKRVCTHFLHFACAEEFRTSVRGGKCPMCRADLDGVLKVPSLDTDPSNWFKVVDLDQDKKLSQAEVRSVLLAQLPVDIDRFEAEMPTLFTRLDIDGDGFLSQQELLRPDGLVTPEPATLNPEPSTLQPKPKTLNPAPDRPRETGICRVPRNPSARRSNGQGRMVHVLR